MCDCRREVTLGVTDEAQHGVGLDLDDFDQVDLAVGGLGVQAGRFESPVTLYRLSNPYMIGQPHNRPVKVPPWGGNPLGCRVACLHQKGCATSIKPGGEARRPPIPSTQARACSLTEALRVPCPSRRAASAPGETNAQIPVPAASAQRPTGARLSPRPPGLVSDWAHQRLDRVAMHADQTRADTNRLEPSFGDVPAYRLGADAQVIGGLLYRQSRIHADNLAVGNAESSDVLDTGAGSLRRLPPGLRNREPAIPGRLVRHNPPTGP